MRVKKNKKNKSGSSNSSQQNAHGKLTVGTASVAIDKLKRKNRRKKKLKLKQELKRKRENEALQNMESQSIKLVKKIKAKTAKTSLINKKKASTSHNITQHMATPNKRVKSLHKQSPNQYAGKKILKAIKRRGYKKLRKLSLSRNGCESTSLGESKGIVPIVIDDDDSGDSDCVCLGFTALTPQVRYFSKRPIFAEKIAQNVPKTGSPIFEPFAASTPNVGTYLNMDFEYSARTLHPPQLDQTAAPTTVASACDIQREFCHNLGDPPILPKSKFSVMTEIEKNEDSIIEIEDTIIERDQSVCANRVAFAQPDASIVIINDSTGSEQPDYIPLESLNVPKPIALPDNKVNRKQKSTKTELFTKSEKKELNKYNDNTYNPSAGVVELKEKRMIIVDGSNVAFHHGLNQEFSVKGLKICIDYFESKGHDVKVVAPLYRMHKCTDPPELEKLHKSGKIVYTPCKNVSGKVTACYDDRFILQLACELDAAIVSNDNYRDLLSENSAFAKIIKNRVIGYTWCNDIFLLPKDPYGRWGPTLQSILNRT